MKYLNVKNYRVLITDIANEKMNAYVDLVPFEISGLGTIKESNGIYTIDDIFLFEQVCSGATTVLDQWSVIKFITELIDSGKIDTFNRLKFWWHSHVDMSTFWSGVDRHTIDSMQSDSVWISIVANKRRERRVSVDYYDPRICLDDVGLEVVKTCDFIDVEKIRSECLNNIKMNVKQHPVYYYSQKNKIAEELGSIEEIEMEEKLRSIEEIEMAIEQLEKIQIGDTLC